MISGEGVLLAKRTAGILSVSGLESQAIGFYLLFLLGGKIN